MPRRAHRDDDSRHSVQVRRRRLAHPVDRQHLVRHGVAGEVEPAPTAIRMAPALAVHALGIVTEEKILAPHGIAGGKVRAADVRGATADKLALITRSAPGTGKLHHRRSLLPPQCAMPEAAASSIRRPVVKRSSWKGSASSWLRPVASTCASVQPPAGIALKPPV